MNEPDVTQHCFGSFLQVIWRPDGLQAEYSVGWLCNEQIVSQVTVIPGDGVPAYSLRRTFLPGDVEWIESDYSHARAELMSEDACGSTLVDGSYRCNEFAVWEVHSPSYSLFFEEMPTDSDFLLDLASRVRQEFIEAPPVNESDARERDSGGHPLPPQLSR